MIKEKLIEKNRAKYNALLSRGYQRRITASFDELLEDFSSECNTLSLLGEKYGVSRERIRQIYNKFFRPILGNKDGWTRVKVCTRKRFAWEKENVQPRGTAEEAAYRAQKAGCEIAAIARARGGRPSTVCGASRDIHINGIHVHVLSCTEPRFMSEHSVHAIYNFHTYDTKAYGRYTLFLIPEHTFIVETKRIKPFSTVYISEVPREEMGRLPGPKPLIDWWGECLEAWHLLSEQTELAAKKTR